MTHKITDVASNEWGEGDYVYYTPDRGVIVYGRVDWIKGTWKEKFSGGYWDYEVQVTRIKSTGYWHRDTKSKPVRLRRITNIVKAPAPAEPWDED